MTSRTLFDPFHALADATPGPSMPSNMTTAPSPPAFASLSLLFASFDTEPATLAAVTGSSRATPASSYGVVERSVMVPGS